MEKFSSVKDSLLKSKKLASYMLANWISDSNRKTAKKLKSIKNKILLSQSYMPGTLKLQQLHFPSSSISV